MVSLGTWRPDRSAGAVLAANWLGAIQVSRKAYREAENLMLRDADQLFSPAAQLSPTEIRLAVGNIIALYEAWGKPEQAAIWRRKLDTFAPFLEPISTERESTGIKGR